MTRNSNDGNLKKVFLNLAPFLALLVIAIFISNSPSITGFFVENGNVTINETINTTDETLSLILNQSLNKTLIESINESLELTINNLTINNITEIIIEEASFSDASSEPVILKTSLIVKDSKQKRVDALITVKDKNNNFIIQTTGLSNTQLTKGKYNIDVDINNKHVKKIEFKGVEVSKNTAGLVKVEDVEPFGKYKKVYSIDPTPSKFTEATVTVTATGTELYKCKDWNFDEQHCYGEWVLFQTGLIPGQEYTFILTPDDPGFAETVSTCSAEDRQALGTFNIACNETNGGYLESDDGVTEAHTYGKSVYAGVRIESVDTSVDFCESIDEVFICYEWWVDVANGQSCDISVDADGGVSYTAASTVCPGITTNPGVTCTNITTLETWTCDSFFNTTGTRALAKSEIDRTPAGADTTETAYWDVLYFNVTYTGAPPLNITQPDDQTVEIGEETTLEWTLSGSGGYYYIERNGTLVEGPKSWVGPEQLIIYEPRTHFLGNWNYTLLYNETGSSTLYDSTVYLNVIDNVTPSCSELGDGSGITSVTVTPDGDLADWQSVLSNPLNYVTDPSALTGDADSVDTADRDMIKFAYTYDETNLYFYFGRLASGSNQIAMLVYLDYDRDGYMNATDDVLNFVWSGSNQLYTSYLYDYVPAVSPGDQMFGDGYNMPGSITNSRILESKVLGGAESGVELETKVLWSDLGLSGITSINFKGAAARGSGGNLPDQLTDNIGELLTPTSTAFLFKPDNEKATTNGTIVYYAHDLMNCGNVQSTIDLYNISSQGWDVKLHYPDSSETEVTDTNGNGIPDITLDVQEYTTLIVEITVPSVVSTGTIDTTNITGQASNYTSTVIDTTTINNIAILPKLYTVSTSQNMNISVNYTIYNYQAISDTINIYSLSSNAWNTYIYYNNSLLTDTNADGFVDTGLLEPLQSKKIELLVEVPVAAVIGTNDSTSIQINSSADPSIFDTSYANSTVYDRLILEPSGYNETVTAGSIHYYEFNITNNWYEPDYINLQYTDTLGWEKTFLDKYYAPLEDSNSDGYADILLEQLGDLEKIFLKVVVPNDAPMGMDEITYIYANSSLDSTVFKTATINNTPRGVALYNDSGRTNLQDVFAIYSTVYAKAFYLQGLSEVYFAWFDGINYVRISPNITVDGSGNADDLIITNSTTYPGVWTIFVYDSSTDAEISRRTFNLTDYVPPSATLISPQPGSIYGYNTTIELAVYASDDILLTELVEAEVVDPEGNITYVFLENAVGDKYNTTFTLGELDGQYNVTFFIRDVAGNLNDSVTTYFIGSDDTPPSMTIHYPGDNAVDVNGNVSFNITSTDDNALQSIELYINGVINQTQSISGIYNETLFEVNELSDGYYNWTIISYDSMNYNQTITRSFLVNTTAAVTINTTTFTGNTTDWNDVPDITNVCDGTAILDAVDDRIRWWDCVDASSIDFDVSVNLTYNLVEIEFGLDDSFNASAEIVMRGLTWDFAPLVYVDGIWCNETCSDVTFDIATGTAIFNVTHFSNYTTVGNSQLEIWDQTDTDKDNLTKYTDSLVAFYANYTTLNKAEPIIGTCTITFNDLIDQPMVYNATSLLYEYNRTFATANIFEYNVTCTGGQTITLTDDVTITSVDTFAPEVNLNYPTNYYNTSDTSILFNWTSVDDSTTTMFCNLTIDGLINITDISTINATPTTQIVLGFNDGLHSWNLSCTDDSCNTNTSETRTFTVDTQAPQWSNNLTSPISLVTYSSGQSYEFNVTWTDTGVGLDAVIIEHDFGGTLTNTTIVTSIGSEFYYTYSDLAAGTYTWREYSNDSLNNLNETDAWLYVINKATPVLTLEANPSWSEIYGTQTTVNCTANTLQVTPQLYLDGTLVSNPHQTILGAGIYNYTCNVTTTENYTSAQTSNLMTIAKATSEVNLSLNNVDGDIVLDLNDFADLNATLVSPIIGYIELYNNGTLINAGLSPLNNYTEFNESGSYNITAYYPATENYTESFETHNIVVGGDIDEPEFIYISPDLDSSYNQTNLVELKTCVSESSTLTALLEWDLTSKLVTLVYNGTDYCYTYTFTNTTYAGDYAVTFNATDAFDNSNISTTNFTVVDITAPSVTDINPLNGAQFNYTDLVNINVNVTDYYFDNIDTVIANITYPDGTSQLITLSEIDNTQIFNNTFSDTTQIGQYTLTIYANDTSGNLNDTELVFFVVNDNVFPSADNPQPTAGTEYNQTDSVTLSINATDNDGIDTVLATITWDSTSETVELTYNAGTGLYDYTWTNTTYVDQYNITYFVNDTSGNVNDTESTYFNVNDVIEPAWSNLLTTPASPTTYAPSQSYEFNVTWTDNVGIEDIIFEWNSINYTYSNAQIAKTGDIYSITFIDLPVSVNSYTWYANDTAGNLNLTQTFTYTIQKATSEVNLLLNGTGADFYIAINDTVNITAYMITPSTGYIELYNNGTLINTGNDYLENITLFNESGIYNITVIYSGNENYTETSETHDVYVSMGDCPPTVILHAPEDNFITNLETINFNCSANDDYAITNITFYWNYSGTFSDDGIQIFGYAPAEAIFSKSVTQSTKIIWNCLTYDNATVPQQDWANTNFTLTVDLDEPVYSNINEYPLDSATYSPGQNYYFNITVTDNLEVSTVILEFAGINYTTTKTGDVYAVTIPNLAVDTYNYIWYMNDTAGNYNTTSSTYTVTPKTSVCLLSFTPVSGSTYTTQGVNASCSCNNLESGEKLYRDNLDVVSENNFYTPLAANTYNYVCNVTATNNYTAASNSSTYIINKEQSIVNLTLNTLDDDITVEVNDNVNVQATLELGESDILLYEDSILINQGLSPLDNITSYSTLSIHNLTVEYPETTNYTFSYDQHFVTVQDTYNPAWSNNISYPEPVTYAPGASYQFNVTWTDETTIDTVIIEHNFNGAFQNFTVPNLGDIYYYDFTDLAAGSYTWKMYANDTSGNLNVTDTFTYTVQKAATTVSLTLNTIQDNVTVTYPNTVTAVYSTNAATASMYRDSIDVTSELGVPRSLGVAVYNYTVINLGDENYTESSITYYATVQRATGTCSLSFNPVSPQTYPVSVTALCSCTNSETLTRNNLDATSEINVATLLGAGLHEYNCSSVETQNYTSAEDIDNYTIYKATSSIDLRLDGTGNNITVEVQTIVNHTASLINHSSGTAEIYINNIQEATGSSPLTKLYNYTTLGTYNVTAFYTATENYSDAHETHYVTVEDTIPPVIETITSAPDTNMVTTSETYNISATATDNYLIDSIVARITLPDGTITEHSLPVNYIPVQTGLHNYTIFVNDTSGNYVISEVKEFLVGTELIYQQYNLVNDTTGIPGTVNVHFSDTESLLHFHLMPGGFEADYHILDFLLDYEYIPDDGIASVYIMGINISVDNNQSLGYYRVVPAATDFIETIGLNTTYSTPQSYTITFSYNDTSYSNENNLAVYKCELWDFENRVCTGTWASIAATQNIADNYFTFTTTGFSGFSIKEEVATTPTTGGGGGGRACVENWQCSAWTPRYCPSSGVQTRDCYDYNNCRTYEYKPSESKTCIYIPEDTELIEDITSELSELVDTYDYTSGDSVIVTVVDLKGNTVPDAEVSVRKPSGDILNFITDSDGKLKFTSDEPGTWKLELIKSGYVGKLFNINIIAPEKLVPELEPVIEKPTSFNSLWLLLLLLIILAFLISHQFVNMATTKKRGKKEVKVVITNISRHWKRTAVDIKLHLKKGSKIRKLSVLNYKGVKIKKLNAKTFIFKNFKLAPGKRLVLSLVYVSTNIKLVSTYRWNSLPFFDLRASEERKTRKINNRARFNDMHAKHLAHRTKIKKHHEEIERLKYNAHRRRVRKYNNIKLSLRTLFILRPRKFITKKVHEFEKSQKISHAKFLKERRKHEKELARVHSIKVKKDSKFEKELKAIRENLKQSRITEKRNFTRKKNILKSSLNTSAKTFKRKNKSMLRDLDNALDEFIKDIRKAPKKFAKLFVKRKKVVKKYPHPKLNAKEIELIKHQIKKDIVVQVLTLKRAGKSYSTIFNKIVLQGYPDYLVKNCLDLVYKINNPKDKVFIKDDILFEVTAKNVKQR